MRHAFTPMPPEHQARFRGAYLSYLRARDGVPNLAARRFDVRERFFAEITRNRIRRGIFKSVAELKAAISAGSLPSA